MSMYGNKYYYKGREFTSIRELAKFVGINEKTLTARLRRNMTLEDACNTKLLNCKYFKDEDGVEKSLKKLCDDNGKDVGLIRNRLKYKYSLDEALNKPKKISKQGKQIVVYGKLYKSTSEALRKLGLVEYESTIRGRLRAGWDVNKAFNINK